MHVWQIRKKTMKSVFQRLIGATRSLILTYCCAHVPFRAGVLSTPVHGADSPVSSGQPQHRPPGQTLRGIRGPQQRGVEQVPERLQGGCSR